MLKIKKYSHGTVELSSIGLKMEVNPQLLIQMSMNENAQNILNKIIEDTFMEAVMAFDEWYKENYVPDENMDLIPACEALDQKFKYDTKVQEIQNLADITRFLLPLHTDGEIDLGKEYNEVFETGYQFFKYNSNYGFQGTEEAEIKRHEQQ